MKSLMKNEFKAKTKLEAAESYHHFEINPLNPPICPSSMDMYKLMGQKLVDVLYLRFQFFTFEKFFNLFY